MSKPLVCAILLVNGRKAMVRRAIASFRAQSYGRKYLLILDTTPSGRVVADEVDEDDSVGCAWMPGCPGMSIGALRNQANGMSCAGMFAGEDHEIVCHFDSDDVSHSQRIAEQVALLQASGADCVGYYEAPFWDTRQIPSSRVNAIIGAEGWRPHANEAWLYRDPARKHVLGASMAYWRKTWERRPFDDINTGEDTRFAGRCKTVAESAIGGTVDDGRTITVDSNPRIVCGVHGSNTSGGYDFTKRQQCFTRAPQFDDYCRKVMTLEAEPRKL